jgi:hypothetical protein
MEDVGLLNGHLIYLILWPFGIFYVYLVYFSRFGMLHQKYGNTLALTTISLILL